MKKFLHRRDLKIALASIILAALVAFLFYTLHFQVLPQVAINFVQEIPAPTAHDRVLVFSPHPDDETIAAGGFIAESIQNKAQVWVVLVTDGNKHGLAAQRYVEFSNSLKTLGVSSENEIFLNYPDGSLANQNQLELKDRFSTIVAQVKPTIVIMPETHDGHPDHATTGKIAEAATQDLAIPKYEYLVHHTRFPQPFGYAPNDYLLPPNDLVTLDRTWVKLSVSPAIEEQKHQAVLKYASQLRTPTLRPLMLGLVRKNELFAIPNGITNP